MTSFVEHVLSELDQAIKEEDSRGPHDFPIDEGDMSGTVEPVYSTWDGSGLQHILALRPEDGDVCYVCITNDGDGVLYRRSEVSDKPEPLMIETEEGWTAH